MNMAKEDTSKAGKDVPKAEEQKAQPAANDDKNDVKDEVIDPWRGVVASANYHPNISLGLTILSTHQI